MEMEMGDGDTGRSIVQDGVPSYDYCESVTLVLSTTGGPSGRNAVGIGPRRSPLHRFESSGWTVSDHLVPDHTDGLYCTYISISRSASTIAIST
jgi:hypothetical protein